MHCVNCEAKGAVQLWRVRVARYSAIAPKTVSLIIHPFPVIMFSDFLSTIEDPFMRFQS